MTITPESVRELLSSEDYGDRLRAVNQIRQLELAPAFELAYTASQDTNTRVRYAALSQMDTLGPQDLPRALELLRDRLLNDPEADVRAAAADCLGALKQPEVLDELCQVYERENEWLVQVSLIAALGELGDPKAIHLLTKALASDTDLVRTAAVGALGELGNPEAVPLLVPFAQDPDWQMRYRVVQALGRLGGPEALSVLQQMQNDESELVSREAKAHL
ncbi:phycobilisome degradation protein NblB [Leptolyngbya sp. FACHB-261]|uniref:phycobilisome degradation protein NblB n=1 Tax=Leptolyngbya sp. FACHB-261 TaxID=2692806 RepID=UPI0016860A64|nr:HEAT repeat domain-containing protein [Leptolyngbya sp. FACHB-261]MBD2100505.1 HEAT repeat domain-containing protein [Leptolyngbya sp. FACHB-261]